MGSYDREARPTKKEVEMTEILLAQIVIIIKIIVFLLIGLVGVILIAYYHAR